jgi:hypothetical protein
MAFIYVKRPDLTSLFLILFLLPIFSSCSYFNSFGVLCNEEVLFDAMLQGISEDNPIKLASCILYTQYIIYRRNNNYSNTCFTSCVCRLSYCVYNFSNFIFVYYSHHSVSNGIWHFSCLTSFTV